MRILQLISTSGFYGAERVLVELTGHLQQSGHRAFVGLLAAAGQERIALAEEAQRRSLPVARFACTDRFDARAMRDLWRWMAGQRIDLLHSHGYKADIYAYLSTAAHGGRGPALVSTCHNWMTDSLKLMLYELLDKLVLHRFHHVVAVSPVLEQELARAGIPADRRSVIDNGLSPDPSAGTPREQVRASLGLPARAPLLVAIGRLDAFKAHSVLLQALAELHAVGIMAHLLLVGDGDLRDELLAQARQLGLAGHVCLAGYRREIGALLQASDLFVISSVKEGLPMVLLEAMAARVPVVSTAVGAIPEVLAGGERGLLAAPGDARDLARALAQALRQPEQAAARADLAHDLYCRQYSREAMGRRYLALYERVMNEASS